MSSWTYINGTITVEPMGRTQPEKRYILDTVLEHLPKVTGSERDMETYVIQERGCNEYMSGDEFGQWSNLKEHQHQQSEYIIVCNAALRDRVFEETFREFQKWLYRLAKRLLICNVVVEVKGYNKTYVFQNNDIYEDLFEYPTWARGNKTGEPARYEYLMWDRMKGDHFPIMLAYKYYKNKENDIEAERRIEYQKAR